jgi:Na+-translocating ferredoxin:NAD+ oxidoreductase RnfG subunit
MTRVRIAALAILAALLAGPGLAQEAPPAKLAQSLGRVFGPSLVADSVRVADTLVLRIKRSGSLVGYAEVLNVRGKDQPITVLVAVDSAAILRDVDILVYREPYGGEVAYESWRKQFRGKGADDALSLNRDIRGISGATISANAVTAGVRRTVAQLSRWRKDGLLN